ncbi:MAG: DUF222 domain-containing protein [Gordonia sp. (in: high G+C Gram-positive bacteria)]|uniref:HNH endonuclease signature motif containing protein n=1 Tax=Gordonia sp. (in: high G+C Gram-positive bacteria) TaxID=84139 RepID=UPI0039E70826
MATIHRMWRDADLSSLGVAPVSADAPDHIAVEDGLASVVAIRAGEGFLKWQQLQNIADMIDAKRSIAVESAVDEFARFLDPVKQVAASVATALHVGQDAGETLVDRADAIRNRLPNTGLLLRDGVIACTAFGTAVVETAAIVEPGLLAEADREIADRLRSSGDVGYFGVQRTARAVVTTLDAEAARDARERAKKTRGIRVWPAGEGLATLAITNTVENIALSKAAIEAKEEHDRKADTATDSGAEGDADTRTKDERLADAAVALIADPDVEHTGARVVVHVIADGSTLDGGDRPGHLEGHGAIDAAHVRDIAARPGTLVRPLDLTQLRRGSAQAGNPYRPTALLDTVVRGLFGGCSWPGCTRPAAACELDHVTEWNADDPDAGGPTCLCNLNPKCTFHHLLKTFGEGWIDDQIIDADGTVWTEVTTPEGHTVRSKARNTWLLPDAGLVPCGHPPPTRPERWTRPPNR